MLSVPWAVTIGGRPMTDRMNPYVESIEVTDKPGETGDTATLVFDDTDGQVMLPPKGAPITIMLGGAKKFEGVTDAPESSGSRGGGMQLTVHCTSHDKRSKVKERRSLHKDDATLEEFLKAAAKEAGIDSVKVDKALGSIKRPYWSSEGRSFQQLGQELADEFGATFKIRGKTAVLAARGGGATPGGASLPSVRAVRGDNLISWRLSPSESRPRFAKARVRYYDRRAAKWKQEDVEVGASPGASSGASGVVDLPPAPRADKDQAKSAAKGRKTASEREGGSGEVTLVFAVEACAEGTCVVEGVRAGIDGSYRIESVVHRVSRGPSTTTLQLKQPQGEAGTDGRKAG
ncbi:late control D family protein [uncultured Methylobacterium sp.]|jgi:phage protein D|uniref:phage late control D family protein n=1 Tax=uncultured Methylobacterium sp. TaxID=157278 RepID=UPI00262BD0A4|nr:late control D family protein [uncultured Methylobacterium sp.]